MRKNVTIKDIAAELGLSHATVSRALNNNARIGSATRKLVKETALRLGYIPNASARSIRGDGARWLGLIVPEIENQYYSSITVAFANHCRANDMRMMFGVSSEDPLTEQREVRSFLESRVSGIVITLTAQPRPETLAMLSSIPVVKLIRRVDELNAPVVTFAEADICRQATDHLLDLGHTRLAYIGTDLSVSSGRERVRGFREALERRGIAPTPSTLQFVSPTEQAGSEAIDRLLALPQPPTALLIAGSKPTVGALRALKAANLSIPDHVSIIAYGDVDWYSVYSPPISAIALPSGAVVDHALALLDAQSPSTRQLEQASVLVDAALVLRESTAPPPGFVGIDPRSPA